MHDRAAGTAEHVPPVYLAIAQPAAGRPWPLPADGDQAAEDLNRIGWGLIWSEGHRRCGGWSFDPATRRLECACDRLAYVLDELTAAAA